MKVKFTNICNHIKMNESLYNTNNGYIEFEDSGRSGAITLKNNTLYIDDTGYFSSSDVDILLKAIETIFKLGYNHYKGIRVIETDGEIFYNINKGESFFCTISFTFVGDIRRKHFDVLIKTNNNDNK